MSNQMIAADTQVDYQPKEFALLVMAVGWGIALGGLVLASIAICGWKSTKSTTMDWLKMRATFNCR